MHCNYACLKTLIASVVFLMAHYASAQSFTIKGNVQGQDTGTAVLHYINADNKKCIDTAVIRQGLFEFKGTVIGTDFAYLDTDPFRVNGENSNNKFHRNLFIEPTAMVLTFQGGAIGNARVAGTNIQNKHDALRGEQRKSLDKLKPLLIAQDSIRTLLKEGSISALEAEQGFKAVQIEMKPIHAVNKNIELSYIQTHPGEFLSLHLLRYFVGAIPDGQVDSMYAMLSDTVKNSSLGFGFVQHYSKYKKAMGNDFPFDYVRLHDPAPSFSIYKAAADSITLSDFRGTVVLLDFWELTCFPCLKAIPKFEKLRSQYSDKQFKVIAVNSTAPHELYKLKAYIAKNKLSKWQHALTSEDESLRSSDFPLGNFKHYYKIGVPRTVLIDKVGRVIYKSDGYSEEELPEIANLVRKAVNDDE